MGALFPATIWMLRQIKPHLWWIEEHRRKTTNQMQMISTIGHDELMNILIVINALHSVESVKSIYRTHIYHFVHGYFQGMEIR